MKTLEQLKELASKCLDGRDFNRLAKFIPYNMIKDFGMEPNEEYNNEERWNSTVVEFTRENVLKQLEEDVRFGFEKALNQRGISASLMFECVMMWNYILEDGEYIPSLGQLNLMAHYMDELNKAFTYVSASPLSLAGYWSSTENSQKYAWYVYFSSGGMLSDNKYYNYRVRAVIDF